MTLQWERRPRESVWYSWHYPIISFIWKDRARLSCSNAYLLSTKVTSYFMLIESIWMTNGKRVEKFHDTPATLDDKRAFHELITLKYLIFHRSQHDTDLHAIDPCFSAWNQHQLSRLHLLESRGIYRNLFHKDAPYVMITWGGLCDCKCFYIGLTLKRTICTFILVPFVRAQVCFKVQNTVLSNRLCSKPRLYFLFVLVVSV